MLEPLPPDPYKPLDVSQDAQFDAIKKRYRELVLKCHPDKCPGPEKAAATDRFAAVQNAWEILGDAVKRQDYHKLVKQHKLAEELSRNSRPPPPQTPTRTQSSSTSYYPTANHHSSPQTPYGFSSRSGPTKTRYEYGFRYSSEPAFYDTEAQSAPREPRRPSSWDEDRARERERSARDREMDRDRGSPVNRDRERSRGTKRDDEAREKKLRTKELRREEKERAKEAERVAQEAAEKHARREEARIRKAKEEEKLEKQRKKEEAKRSKEKVKLDEKRQEEERRARKPKTAEAEMRDRMKKASLDDDARQKKTPVTEEVRVIPDDFVKNEREHEKHTERPSRSRESGRPKEERRSSRSTPKRQPSNPRRATYSEDPMPASRSYEEESTSNTKVLSQKLQNQQEAALQYMISRGGMPSRGGVPSLSRTHTTMADGDVYGSTEFSPRAPKLHRSATEKVSSSRRAAHEDYDGYAPASGGGYADVHGAPFARAKLSSVDTRNPTTSSWAYVETSQWDLPEYQKYDVPESRSRYRTASYY